MESIREELPELKQPTNVRQSGFQGSQGKSVSPWERGGEQIRAKCEIRGLVKMGPAVP